MKYCRKCKKDLPISSFAKHKNFPGGVQYWCRACHYEVQKWGIRKRLYGITKDEYNKLWESQGGCCAICGIHQSELPRALDLDHCHKTNIVRGFLCHSCNMVVGWIENRKSSMAVEKLIINTAKYLG